MTPTSGVTRRSLAEWLAKNNLKYPYAKVWPYWLSPTIARFRKLAEIKPDKFQVYLEVIEVFLDIAKRAGVSTKLVLHLPSLEALLNIDIKYLFKENKEARKEIIKRCYFPANGTIDFNPLVMIDKNFPRPG
ncbi:MAG: hypothetical protein ACPL4K_03960 [Candidatus Margulisiibacteriota bacterium]